MDTVILIKDVANWNKNTKGRVRRNIQRRHKEYFNEFEYEFLPEGYTNYWFGVYKHEFQKLN